MPGTHAKRFTQNHEPRDDGVVAFSCSQDDRLWPWAALDPHHPGAIQALSYWVSVECAAASGNWDSDKWSALTWTRWQCGEEGVGRFAGGTYARTTIDGKESFSITLHDAAQARICQIDGRGVVFRTRDFEAWRRPAKDGAGRSHSSDFSFADAALLGLAPGERPFLAPLEGDTAVALLDEANAMPPGHPWLDGSGDHVNSAHLAEAARQFVSLLRGGEPFAVESAEMRFDRYVELGCPFVLRRVPGQREGIAIEIVQNDKICTRIVYALRTESAG